MNAEDWQAEADRLTILANFEFDNERCDLLFWASQLALWGAMQ
jgi:hypothetical protein